MQGQTPANAIHVCKDRHWGLSSEAMTVTAQNMAWSCCESKFMQSDLQLEADFRQYCECTPQTAHVRLS